MWLNRQRLNSQHPHLSISPLPTLFPRLSPSSSPSPATARLLQLPPPTLTPLLIAVAAHHHHHTLAVAARPEHATTTTTHLAAAAYHPATATARLFDGRNGGASRQTRGTTWCGSSGGAHGQLTHHPCRRCCHSRSAGGGQLGGSGGAWL